MPEMPLTCRYPFRGSACPCRRLLDPWNIEDPPETVCASTARATVQQWVEDRWRGQILALITTEAGAVPASMDTIAATRPELAALLAEMEQYRKRSALLDRWPFPVEAGHLLLIVRQWAQEAPNEMLANQLADDPVWARTTDLLRARHHKSAQLAGEHKPWNDRLLENIVSLLARCQVPATPANIGFTLASIVGTSGLPALPSEWQRLVLYRGRDKRPLPARGLQVSTLIFAALELVDTDGRAPSDQQVAWQVQANAELGITGDLAHLTIPFVEHRLPPILVAHRDFAAHLARHPFTLSSARRHAQPGSFAHRETPAAQELDYLEEARHAAQEHTHLLKNLPPLQADIRIKQLLDRTQSRVAQRRRRAGVATTPPKGWRTEAERQIRRELTR